PGPIWIADPCVEYGALKRLQPSLPLTRPFSNRTVAVVPATREAFGKAANTQAVPFREGVSSDDAIGENPTTAIRAVTATGMPFMRGSLTPIEVSASGPLVS